METLKPQDGEWTLTAPDGRQWKGANPLRCVAMERGERVPPEIALERILASVQYDKEATDPCPECNPTGVFNYTDERCELCHGDGRVVPNAGYQPSDQ